MSKESRTVIVAAWITGIFGCLGAVIAGMIAVLPPLIEKINNPPRENVIVVTVIPPTLSLQTAVPPSATPEFVDIPPTVFIPTPTFSGTGANYPAANLQNVWVDYDVTENNQQGMRIHLNFTIDNLQGVQCQAVAFFYYSTGEMLKDFNNTYSSVNGQVSIGQYFTPAYVNTVFNDLTLFMPYSELHMEPGSYNLAFQVLLFDISQGVSTAQEIGRSNFVYFDLTQQ
jgi:hypothetical protein